MDPAALQTILMENVVPIATGLLVKLGGALAFWIIGKRVISFGVSLLERALTSRNVDTTARRYLTSALNVGLTILLVMGIFGYLGVETATFAALLAGAGLAIGTAWGDLLKNFAAGVFMLVLRPFKVGEFVTAAGVTGTVIEIGMFVTTIDTPDNVRTMVGNSAVFGGTIQNFTHNPFRRVDLVAQISGDADWKKAIDTLRTKLAAIPNVTKTPAPDVFVLTFTERGPVLCVRPYTHNDHYWQVYFDTNAAIIEACGEAGLPGPVLKVQMVNG